MNEKKKLVLYFLVIAIAIMVGACDVIGFAETLPDDDLTPPEDLIAFMTEDGGISLNWLHEGGGDLILRRYNPETNELLIFDDLPSDSHSIVDDSFECGNVYRYFLSAHNGTGNSSEVCIVVQLPDNCRNNREMVFRPCNLPNLPPGLTPMPLGICGDGICQPDENFSTCPDDCGTVCGDGICEGLENYIKCPADCGGPMITPTFTPVSTCGNGICDAGETFTLCPSDCPTVCGDGLCEGMESSILCPDDCGGPYITPTPTPVTVCGNDICEEGESFATCEEDCPTVCGDGVCEGLESSIRCPADCGGPMITPTFTPVPPANCGNGTCDEGETYLSCSADCLLSLVPFCGDSFCGESESCFSCPQDCGPCFVITLVPLSFCGDGYCSDTESYSTCPADCIG